MNDSVIQASAARFLIDGGEEDAASLLLACSMSIYDSGDTSYAGDETHYAVHVEMTGPRAAYDVLNDESNSIRRSIHKAIQAVLPSDRYVKHFTVHAEQVEIDPDWRAELLEIARGRGVHNQAPGVQNGRVWRNLLFRSQSEVGIAQALDNAGVLYLPNCRARLGLGGQRFNREADFLVCASGNWGILEVDGEPFHPPSRTVQDHERDRLFRSHGIKVVEHFDADRCYQQPEHVVQEFLRILAQA